MDEASEFIHHPDFQQISSFFLGTVFITSLNYSFQWIRGFFPVVRRWISRRRSRTNDLENNTSEKASIMTSLSTVRSEENLTLVFALSLCFFFASIAFFGSLLSFPILQGGDPTCAFLVAWGGVATQTASIVGIFALLLELRGLGIGNVEHYASLAFLFVQMVLVFTNNAIGTGNTKSIEPLHDAICYRKHFLPTAVTTSLIAMFLEFYVLLRFSVLLMRSATLASQRPAALWDSRLGKVLSLLLLEVMTIGPSAVHITLVADFVPLSIGALFVLWTFNTYKFVQEEKNMLVFNPNDPSLLRSTWFSTSSEGSGELVAPAILPAAPTIAHPFSSQYERQTFRFSPTSTIAEEGVIQTVRRTAPSTATATVLNMGSEARPTQTKSSHVPPNVSSVTVMPPSPKVQVTSPEPSPSVSPTSILMHPWHRDKRKRRSSADDIDLRSLASTIRGERFSYTVQGLSFPMPPVTSPTAATRRYSSSTLASVGFPQEGREGEGRKKVHLLTFASAFRSSVNGEEGLRIPRARAQS